MVSYLSNPIFQIKDLTYESSDGGIKAVNLDLYFQEVHVLIIKNSAEQSILIESLKSFTKDIEGQIIFKGKNINKKKFFKNKISILHRRPILIEEFSVAENIHFMNFPKVWGIPLIKWRKINKKALEILKTLNLDINPKKLVKGLTREEKKIVYIAKTFAENPDIIIMHEPTEVLSASNVSRLNRLIQLYKNDGGSIIYITKQWEEVLKFADQISVLSKGEIKGSIPAETVKNDPQKLLNMIGNYNYSNYDSSEGTEIKKMLDAVFKSTEFLTSEYELQDVLLLLSKEVTNVMNAVGCIIHLIDESTDEIIDTLEYKVKPKIQAKMKKEQLLNISKKSEIYYANQKDTEFSSLFETKNQVKTIICVPVSIKSRITGIIQIIYEDFYIYSKEEYKYLSTFADHAAIAIEDTRLMGRSALLQESHHRIKNNLQSIVALISLQKNFTNPESIEQANEILDTIASRIKSIAKVHDILAKDKTGRSIVNVKTIIQEIILHMTTSPNITIDLDLDDIFIPYNKATSIALLINELVINCFKHAFSDHENGEIKINCNRVKGDIILTVKDNGKGLGDDFDVKKLESLGLSIVKNIVSKEFKGEVSLYNDGGTVVDISIPDTKVF